ncbi:MAG: NAD(+) synthase [Treponema sp.]|nr:NAD(+) synthase [Treponema sp.]
MNYGFFRVACASPELKVCDCHFNAEKIIDSVRLLSQEGASLIVFPELSITGYTCQDLFFQKSLQLSALENLEYIAKKTSSLPSIFAVGLPFCIDSAIYNCAALIHRGKILCLIPKTFIPNYSEFYEKRHFASSQTAESLGIKEVYISEKNPFVPFGRDILVQSISNPDFTLALELCEDLWVPQPPSVLAALKGASVIANLSASNELIGKAEYRKNLVKMHSARILSAYLYASAGHDESTQDLVFSGHNLICENGSILEESPLFSGKSIIADIDLERLLQERRKTVTFSDCASLNLASEQKENFRIIKIDLKERPFQNSELKRLVPPQPFVPEGKAERSRRCASVIQLQAEGLAKRLRHINCKSAVIGLSGGLDSTLALLVTAKAFDLCGFDRKGILAVTMPCFGTTDRTYNNACALAREVGAELKEVRIAESVRLHFKDISQDENVHDVTYENCQARERTQVLMDLANKTNGIVIGTGDLSELALGWCTYNGDQMSMYGVNSSIPKTLVRHLVDWFADEAESSYDEGNCSFGTENKSSGSEDDTETSSKSPLSAVLRDILDTPVSPELLPPENGKISQKTEDLVGPYELHDFYLYYLLRFAFSPEKILFLSDQAKLPYSRDFKIKWLRTFYRRFFNQQFKRSCMPDGAKVGTVNLSPRGDWRMPSDASAALWLEEIDRLK